jgi:CheY-like chemotaxis protein
MDGMQATQHIRELPNGKQVKIIALTASAFDEERNEVLAIGMDDFVRKPFRASEIYDCLSKHLGVQYLYQDTVKPQQKADTLTSEKLAVLPQALRQQLRDALESLDSTRITAIISKISETEAELASTLSNLTKNYDYQPILIALGGVIDD